MFPVQPTLVPGYGQLWHQEWTTAMGPMDNRVSRLATAVMPHTRTPPPGIFVKDCGIV